jgi:hypothetical protein
VFSETIRLGQTQSADADLTYVGSETKNQQTVFRFRAAAHAPALAREGFLIPSGSRGDFVQFRRRSRALRLLKDHTELLRILVDPRSRLSPTHEKVNEDQDFAQLDEAKQTSLKALVAVLPVYMLQGPPGVGKTFLVKDLVRRRFEKERVERLLITAQGNHALDHLLDELSDLWTGPGAPLAVRCRPKDDHATGPHDLYVQTRDLAIGLATSPLVQASSSGVKQRLQALANPLGTDNQTAVATERRALEGLVMRSANIVLATTNSADVEHLLREKGQFDWTIVEEAGKATGCELIAPLMLSHRRLLIGDHKQLPPFGADDLEKLLGEPKAIRGALVAMARVVDRTVRNLLDEDLLEFIEDDEQDLESLCAEAIRSLYLFETGLTTELDRQKRAGGDPIASTLTFQHRMHPAICRLVASCFYDNLRTSERREKAAIAEAKWLDSNSPAELPNVPVVFVNMPYERSTAGKRKTELLPRFTNEDEVQEIVRLIKHLRVTEAAPRKPALVFLAPYARQVRRLKEALMADDQVRTVLEQFKPAARGDEWCSTVDAFQGNEADVVVFSLVRNNRGATIRRALGFVGDGRRFNVLLSRAKQRLIFVGSRQFLEVVARPIGLETKEEGAFLRKFLSTLDQLVDEGSAQQVNNIQVQTTNP